MTSKNMPRVNELRALIDDPSDASAYFQDFDASVCSEPDKRRAWLAREAELQRLDLASWEFLKAEARPYLTARAKQRGWEQLIAILNQARAYNYLADRGASDVSFIPRTKGKGRKTPDLQAVESARRLLCEVKTINISQDEARGRNEGSVRSTTNILTDAFFNKLASTITGASCQMSAHDSEAKKVVFMIVNFDDLFSEYKTDYYHQIDQHLDGTGPDIVFFNQRTAFHGDISMCNAQIVNEL